MADLKPVAIIPADSLNAVCQFDTTAEATKAARDLPPGAYLIVRVMHPVEVAPPPQATSNVVKVGPGFIQRTPKTKATE